MEQITEYFDTQRANRKAQLLNGLISEDEYNAEVAFIDRLEADAEWRYISQPF